MEATEKSITIDIPSGAVTPDVNGNSRGWNAYLLLDPEARKVTLWTIVGAGCPEAVHNSRALVIGLPNTASGEAVAALVEAEVGLVERIFAEYLGSHWNGSSQVGKWMTADDAAEEILRDKLQNVATYWAASDWLAGDDNETKRQVREAGPDGLDALAKQIVDDGGRNDALLDEQDVRRCLGWYAEKIAEE